MLKAGLIAAATLLLLVPHCLGNNNAAQQVSECDKEAPKQKYVYLGCFGDASNRDLPNRMNIGMMSVEACYRACDALRYKYFALQSGHMCHCGNAYGLYGQKNDRDCYRRCNGNADEFCGGDWRNCLYEIKIRNQF